MEKPIYVAPSIYLTKAKKIKYNKAFLAELKAWEAKQNEDKK